MRREFAYSLLGFLGGFVVAAFVFWQPAGSPDSSQSASSTNESAGQSRVAEPGTADSGRRPIVVAADGEGALQPEPGSVPQVKAPAELLHEALATLSGLDPNRRQAALNELMNQLRAAGPEGLQAVRDFFRAGQDVKFQGGFSMVNGKYVQTPSFRVALLNALGDWPGPEATSLTLEILRTTPRMSEASIAIRQLEAKSPGTYRAEAIQTLLQIAAAPPDKDMPADRGNSLFDAMSYFKAAELIPAAEKLVAKNPWSVSQYTQALESLPTDVRRAALERLFANPDLTKSLGSNAWALQSLNYSEPVVTQNVAALFASNTDKKFRENFLTSLSANRGFYVPGNSFGPSTGKATVQVPSTETRVAQLQAKLALLDQIAPECTTAVLQERLQDARTALETAIANPGEPTKFGGMSGGTIQLNGVPGSAVIQGDGINVIEFQSRGGK